MSKKKKILPELRFPEFANNETWAERKLSDVLFEHKEKSTGNEEVYSVSVNKGVINQIEHLGRVFASSNTDNYKRVLPGDIIYTKSPTGDFPFGIIKQSKASKPVIVSPLYGVFKPETNDIGIIIDAYFEYPERTINYLSSIIQKGAKNTINIHNDTFLSKSLVLPLDKKEQSKIASCLSSLDQVIVAHTEKMDLLKDHKKGLMQNLFPQESEIVPNYRFKEFKNSGNWIEKKLNEICDVNPSSKGLPEKFIYIDLESVEDGILKQKKYISISEAPSRAQRLLIKGDVIFQTVRPYQQNNYFFLPSDSFKYVASTGYAQLRAYESASFLYQLIHNPNFLGKVLAKCTGSNYPAINSSELSEIPIFLPSKVQEQNKIASCLSALDEIIKAQSEIVEQLKLYKKGLMQCLFPKAID
jgi:type I restriction enzyme S subunit